MRTTVTLDDEAYEVALTLARSSGKRLGEVISALIRRAVEGETRPKRKKSGRFPAFEVPQGLPPISLRAVRRDWEAH